MTHAKETAFARMYVCMYVRLYGSLAVLAALQQ